MSKLFVGWMLVFSLFIGACGSSSGSDSDTADDVCTSDPSLPECQIDDGGEDQPTEEEE